MSKSNSISAFANVLEDLSNEASRTQKKLILSGLCDDDWWPIKINIITGEYTNIGVGEETVKTATEYASSLNQLKIAETFANANTITEGVQRVQELDDSFGGDTDDISYLKDALSKIEDISMSITREFAVEVLSMITEPWVASFAVLDDVSVGVSHNTICNAVAPDELSKREVKQARGLHPETVDFIHAVNDDEADIASPTVGEPFAPMKAKSKDLPEDESNWVAQPKLDGYRCTVHIGSFKGGEQCADAYRQVKAFSTSLDDRSKVLPELTDINWPTGEWVFDTEVVSESLSYGETSERMQRKGASDLPHTMNFWVFDVIVADGENVSSKTFEERMDILFENLPASEYLVPVHAFDDIAQARDEAERHGFEGLILKEKNHSVQFGERSSDWLKAKMTEETVDLRVAGFQEGTGRNAGKLGAVELATEDGQMLGSCGNGFTDEMRDRIWKNKKDWEDRIVELSFDASASYGDGLRFPRFEQTRDDKREANSYDRYLNLIQ